MFLFLIWIILDWLGPLLDTKANISGDIWT